MSDDKQTAWDDAHSLGIALKLAQAQNRELRKQLTTATEALERIMVNPGGLSDTGSFASGLLAKQALAAIKQNQG